MKNNSGVIILAVIFISLFAMGLGAVIAHRHPAIFKGADVSVP